MKTKVITHPFFPARALMFIINGEIIFMYQTEKNSAVHLWWTYEPYTGMQAVNKLLSECAEGMHTDLGSSMTGSLQECMEDLKPVKQTIQG